MRVILKGNLSRSTKSRDAPIDVIQIEYLGACERAKLNLGAQNQNELRVDYNARAVVPALGSTRSQISTTGKGGVHRTFGICYRGSMVEKGSLA